MGTVLSRLSDPVTVYLPCIGGRYYSSFADCLDEAKVWADADDSNLPGFALMWL